MILLMKILIVGSFKKIFKKDDLDSQNKKKKQDHYQDSIYKV